MRILVSGETAVLSFAIWLFFRRFGTWKYFSPELLYDRFPVPEVPIFQRFASGETAGFSFPKLQIFQTFRHLKNFFPKYIICRFHLHEVHMFGCFGAWECVFSLPAKRPTYLSRKDYFSRRFGTRDTFFLKEGTADFPIAMCPFLDVLEPQKHYSRRWRNCQLTVREMTIFSDVSSTENFSPEIRNLWVRVSEVTIFGRSESEKPYSRLQRNGRLIVKEMTIFSNVAETWKCYCRNTERSDCPSRRAHFYRY